MLPLESLSKEAQYGPASPPPRRPITAPQAATVVPLEQLWTRIPQARRQELLGQLTRVLSRQLAPPSSKGAADE